MYKYIIVSIMLLAHTVEAIILTRRIYNDFPKLTSLRVAKVTILSHSQRSIGRYFIFLFFTKYTTYSSEGEETTEYTITKKQGE